MTALTLAGLSLILRLELASSDSPLPPVALLIVETNGVIAIVLPYTAERVPLRVRAPATGRVACTKGAADWRSVRVRDTRARTS